jgi:hypothetical protein
MQHLQALHASQNHTQHHSVNDDLKGGLMKKKKKKLKDPAKNWRQKALETNKKKG